MKKINLLLSLIFILGMAGEMLSQNVQGRRKKLWANDMNYEAVVVSIGADGTKLIKVWAYAKKIPIAKMKAKQNAVAACLFKGIHGSRDKNIKPIVTDPRKAALHEDYFNKFFDFESGAYVRYVSVTNDATGKDIIKQKGGMWRGGYKVGMIVSVNYDALRKEMERQKIVKKLGDVLGKAKKPTIMIVPSDNWCIKNGFKMTFNNQGTTQTLPDYTKALQNNSDLLLVISKLNTLMAERGFPAKNLETELKNLASRGAETSMLTSKNSGAGVAVSPIDMLKSTAKADIIMQLTWSINRKGPKRSITFNLQGLDAYTGKQIAGAQGTGTPSISAETPLLLEEAVLAHLDNFNAQLMTHFQDIAANGREIVIFVKTFDDWDEDLETEYDVDGDEDELSIFIEDFITDNAYQNKANLSDGSATLMKFEQVRIPLFYERKGKKRAYDAKRFVNKLRKYLKQEPFAIDSKLYMRGLGEAWLILGK